MPRSALPRIKLPNFSGDYPSWRPFHDLFTSLIKDNPDLTSVEKIHYLKTCLTQEAARLVANLSISGDNFQIAWDLLVSRYENKRFLINAQLDRLTSLKPLKTKSQAQGLKNLLTTITEATAALRSLGCAVHSWDPLLLHHLVRLLDSESREAWEVSLGSSTAYPTFAQFEEFLVGRTQALENLGLATSPGTSAATSSGRYRTKALAHVVASPSNTSLSSCPLCGASHHLARCERYQTKTANNEEISFLSIEDALTALLLTTLRGVAPRNDALSGKKHHSSIHEVYREPSSTHATATLAKSTATQSEEKPELQPTID